jgi:hypothetical protein
LYGRPYNKVLFFGCAPDDPPAMVLPKRSVGCAREVLGWSRRCELARMYGE